MRKHKHFHFSTDQTGKKGLVGQRVSRVLFYFSVFKVSGSWAKYQPSSTGPCPQCPRPGCSQFKLAWKPTLIRLTLQLQFTYSKSLNFPVFQRKLWSGTQGSAEMTLNAQPRTAISPTRQARDLFLLLRKEYCYQHPGPLAGWRRPEPVPPGSGAAGPKQTATLPFHYVLWNLSWATHTALEAASGNNG